MYKMNLDKDDLKVATADDTARRGGARQPRQEREDGAAATRLTEAAVRYIESYKNRVIDRG